MQSWINACLALFAIVNPLGNLPLFAELAVAIDGPTRRRLYNTATVTGLVTLLLLALFGQWVMDVVFRIEMAEFKIAGGIMLTVIAVRNVAFGAPETRIRKSEDVLEFGVVPLAVPLLVGPGAVVTAILILNRDGAVIATTSIVAVFGVTWVILQASALLHRWIGRLGSRAMSRILQIFIGAIGAHFLMSGLKESLGIASGG
ncbi:MAG: MarC family protein [Polyangiaceae bacterium]|nr:MarC family protein [Polyangiaceae bacterium]